MTPKFRPPFFTLEELDRTIFEYLRKGVVAAGYLPDVSLYVSSTAFKAAKDSLRSSLAAGNMTLVEIFGVGSSKARDGKTDCKITIDRMGTPQGSLGAFGAYYYAANSDLNPTLYNIYGYPDKAVDVLYDIRIITETAKMERIVHQIIYKNLGLNRYHLSYNPITFVKHVDKYFLLELSVDTNLSKDGMLELLMKYVVRDVFIGDGNISEGGDITYADEGFLLDGYTREPVIGPTPTNQLVPMSTARFYLTPTLSMSDLPIPDVNNSQVIDIPSSPTIVLTRMVWSAWAGAWNTQTGSWDTQRYQ